MAYNLQSVLHLLPVILQFLQRDARNRLDVKFPILRNVTASDCEIQPRQLNTLCYCKNRLRSTATA